jgi:hypothetical protein
MRLLGNIFKSSLVLSKLIFTSADVNLQEDAIRSNFLVNLMKIEGSLRPLRSLNSLNKTV